jgi:hypothetical protein
MRGHAEQFLVQTISLTYLTLHAVTLYSPFEMTFRNADKDGSRNVELVITKIDDTQWGNEEGV